MSFKYFHTKKTWPPAKCYGFCEDVLGPSKAFPALKWDCEILARLSYSMLLDNVMNVST